MLFDAHIHLNEVPEKERAFPLPAAVLTSIHDPEDPALRIDTPEILRSYGIHPLWLDEKTTRAVETLEILAATRKIAAVGECGFDFYHSRDETKERQQRELFRAQCAVAEKYALPLVIHVRRGMAELFAEDGVLKRLPAVIFHCYPGTAEEGRAFLKRGVNAFFSFGTPLIKKFPGALRTVQELPKDRILFETDAPFQPPRGQERTLPLDIRSVYEKAAELLDISLNELEQQVWAHAVGIFPQLATILR